MLFGAVALVVLFRERLLALDMPTVWTGLHQTSPAQWAAAMVATMVSFWAVGHYDAVLHRALDTGIGERQARRAGITAIALSQTIGFGVLSGALVRWRLLPGLGFWQAVQLSALVALSFMAAWALIGSVVLLVLPSALPQARLLGGTVLTVCILLMLLRILYPQLSLRGLHLPRLPMIREVTRLAALDTFAAAMVFYALLPAQTGLDFALFFPAFLLAFGAGLVSGTPGGMGPFEIALIALLPQVPAESLMSAAIGYRAVYYALPAILAVPVLAKGAAPRTWPSAKALNFRKIPARPVLSPKIENLIANAPMAEANLLRQGGKALLSRSGGPTALMVARPGQSIVALRDPLAGNHDEAVAILRQAACRSLRIAAFYKCSARQAVAARRAGFFVRPIARETWLDPRSFDESAPGLRQLRRKLRKARAGDVAILCSTGPLPLADMARINAEWTARQGGERGFSMGYFCPTLIQSQRVYLAYAGGRLEGFITVNQVNRERSLDLMRQAADAPEGLTHALVTAAIRDAAVCGCTRFSLAAVPLLPERIAGRKGVRSLTVFLDRLYNSISGGRGLGQFKSAFGPHWQTLYMAAPSRSALLLAAIDIRHAVIHPETAEPAAGEAGRGRTSDRPAHTRTARSPAGHRSGALWWQPQQCIGRLLRTGNRKKDNRASESTQAGTEPAAAHARHKTPALYSCSGQADAPSS